MKKVVSLYLIINNNYFKQKNKSYVATTEAKRGKNAQNC